MSLFLNGLLILLLQTPGAAVESTTPADAAAGQAAPAATTPAAVTESAAPASTPESPAASASETVSVTETAESTDAAPAGGFSAATTDAAETSTAAADSTAAEAPAGKGSGFSGILLLFAVLAAIVLPFVIGQFLATSLNCQEWGVRFGVCLFALVVGVAPFAIGILRGKPVTEIVRLGIDLKGGTNIVFQVLSDGKEINNTVMERMVGAVGKRINPSGTEEITVRQVGSDRIEVIVPGEDAQAVDEIKRRITRLGTLEFFIAANPSEDRETVQLANSLGKEVTEVMDSGNNLIAIWRAAYEKNGEPKLLQMSDMVRRSVEKIRSVDGKMEKYTTEEYLLLVDPPEERITGKYLTAANTGFGDNGQIVVNFAFNQRGGFLFQSLTSRNLPNGRDPRKLAILLDHKVFTAPQINSVITDRGFIEGGANGFSQEEAAELADVLNAGALEAPIDPKPLSEATIDPTLGADVRRKGVASVIAGGLLVVLFMLFYYRFAGVVAVISLMLNLILIMGIMVLINATFTLPGLAGIVLTIGMAVDSNVLIYERMREELARGSSLRMAIQAGFEKAFSSIFDSNVTTLLTTIVLFIIGTDSIKGFAVTLFIGIVMSMFSALYLGRLIFDVAERRRWITTLNMVSMGLKTQWDFLKNQRFWITASIVYIGIGVLAFLGRGERSYDIDFTGGTMVTFQLNEPGKTEDVQKVLAAQFKENFTVERLALAGDTTEGVGRHFRLRTAESDSEATQDDKRSAEERVRDRVNDAFKGNDALKLKMVSMTFGDVSTISVPATDESAEALAMKRFEGGSTASLTFSDEVAAGTITDMLSKALSTVKNGEQPKYGDATSLMEIVGTEGSGMTAADREVRKYSKLDVRVLPTVAADDLKAGLTGLQSTLNSTPLFDEVNTFASAVASEMKSRALVAIVVSMLVITLYIWFRFENVNFGLAILVALVHDVLFVLGTLAFVSYINGTPIGDLFMVNDFRINMSMIAAFLTLVGFSLNDTIVIFDRVREVRGKNPRITAEMVNTSLNQTLSRTILTSLTVWLVVIVLYVMGGEGIHGFAFCLTVGVLVGTYSTIYIASPVMLWLSNRNQPQRLEEANLPKANGVMRPANG